MNNTISNIEIKLVSKLTKEVFVLGDICVDEELSSVIFSTDWLNHGLGSLAKNEQHTYSNDIARYHVFIVIDGKEFEYRPKSPD